LWAKTLTDHQLRIVFAIIKKHVTKFTRTINVLTIAT
jgi:hypothetical protein